MPFGPSYAQNKPLIDKMVTGATIFAEDFYTVLTDLNFTSTSMGASLGDFSKFGTTFAGAITLPFSQTTDVVSNIIAGYSAAISSILTEDVGSKVYKYRNLGGF